MATQVWGCSDDLVEFRGDVYGEVGCYGTDDRDNGILLLFSDGTILEAKYGKLDLPIWELKLHKQGELLERIDPCTDEDSDPYSDMAHFRDGLKWAYAAEVWERVK